MDDHLIKVNAAAEACKDQQSEPNNEKSEISSLLIKGSSDFGTTFGDSAYGSLGHSAYSSIGPINPLVSSSSAKGGNNCPPNAKNLSKTLNPSSRNNSSTSNPSSNPSSSTPSSKSSELSGSGYNKSQPVIVKRGNECTLVDAAGNKISPPKNLKSFKEEKKLSQQLGFFTAQDSKAAKVATLSKALGYIDQLRILKKVDNSGGGSKHDTNVCEQPVPKVFEVSQFSSIPLHPPTPRKSTERQDPPPGPSNR